MKFRSMFWLAAAAALTLVAGSAMAQQKDPKAGNAEQSQQDGGERGKTDADARRQADAEAAKQRRAERKASTSRSGDAREEEEEKPAN